VHYRPGWLFRSPDEQVKKHVWASFLSQGEPKKITDQNKRYMSAICTISIRPSVRADEEVYHATPALS
jgi:hypothetical protein